MVNSKKQEIWCLINHPLFRKSVLAFQNSNDFQTFSTSMYIWHQQHTG